MVGIQGLLTVPHVVLIGGVVGIVSSSLRVATGLASLRWQATKGRVLARDIDDRYDKYQPALEYSYEASGAQYRGHRISFDFDLRRNAAHAALLLFHKYRPGQEITVFFDPARPYRSVIERGVSAQLLLALAGCVSVVVWVLIPL